MKRKTLQSLLITSALLLMCVFSISAFGIQGKPSVIAYLDDHGEAYTRIYVYAEGDNGTLVANRWADVGGLGWDWEDLGLPAGAASIWSPSAVTYTDSKGRQYQFVFVLTDQGHLAVYAPQRGNGSAAWVDLTNLPGGIGELSSLSAITDVDASGNHRVFAFAENKDANLVVVSCTSLCEWQVINGSHWSWFNYSSIWGHVPVCCISALSYDSYPNGSRIPKIAITGTSADGTLWAADGDDFQNLNLFNFGLTNDGSKWISSTAIYSYTTPPQVQSPCNSLIVFSGATDGHLNGLIGCKDTFFQTQLKFDQNVPPQLPSGKRWVFDPTAVTYTESDYSFRTSVFISAADGRLYRDHANGTNLQWDPLPVPSDTTHYMNSPAAVTFWHYSPDPWIYVFATDGSTQDLVVNYCNNACDDVSNWNWADQGTL